VESTYTPYGEQRTVIADKFKSTTIAANGVSRAIPLEGTGSLVLSYSGTWTGTTVWEVSIDGTTYVSAIGIETAAFTYAVGTGAICAGTCSGTYQFILQQGYRFFRVRSTAWTSGTVTLLISATAQTGIFGLSFIEGDVANDGADNSTRPVKIGGKAFTGLPTAVADADRVNAVFDVYGVPMVRQDHPNRFSCSADNIAATLTELSAGCSAATVPSTASLYITDVIAQSTTATAGQFILRSGTGTNCGTGTTSVLPSAATVVRFSAAGNGVAPTVINFTTPIKVTADHGLCVLGVATNTVTIQVTGFIAP